MSDTDPLAPVLRPDDPTHRPQRTLAGAVATAALFGLLLSAVAWPAATAVALAAFGVGAALPRIVRRLRRRRRVEVCLPGTRHCVSL